MRRPILALSWAFILTSAVLTVVGSLLSAAAGADLTVIHTSPVLLSLTPRDDDLGSLALTGALCWGIGVALLLIHAARSLPARRDRLPVPASLTSSR